MGFFTNQLLDVVEWQEHRNDQIFYKWNNNELKKDSRLIIRPGQDAVFMYNGKVEGIFTDEGSFDIESQIIPFLSTLKGWKFGFNSGLRAEVLFINTRELQFKWGTKNPVQIAVPGLPGGIPIRANGTASFKVKDYMAFIEQIAGVKNSFVVEDVKEQIMSTINQLLMKWITKEGKDMFNLQANSFDISKGIKEDLNYEFYRIGLQITQFNIVSFNYPEQIQKMAEKAASQYMIGDMNKYSQMAMIDNMGKSNNSAASKMSSMGSMMMEMQMTQQMMSQMMPNMQTPVQAQPQQQAPAPAPTQAVPSEYPKFCPNCGSPTTGANFCGNCGQKLK